MTENVIPPDLNNFLNHLNEGMAARAIERQGKAISEYTDLDFADMFKQYIDWRIQQNDRSGDMQRQINFLQARVRELWQQAFPNQRLLLG